LILDNSSFTKTFPYSEALLAKSRVNPVSAVKIAKNLHDSTQDQDPLEDRIGAIVYAYKKSGISIEQYSDAIKQITGVSPEGLEAKVEEENMGGVSGLQEILEQVLGEEQALAIIHELSEILGSLSPYRDSIIELLDYEKQIYAVANLKKTSDR